MYVIKHIPADFVVNEVTDIEFKPGKFFCYWLNKDDYTTLAAIKVIAKENNLSFTDFSFAGNKDRRAITRQLISVKNHKLKKTKFDKISLEFAGTLDHPVSLGMLKGNEFIIIMRNISKLPDFKEEFVNLFGEQRFSENNAEIGRAIVKSDFKKATELLKLDVDASNYVAALTTMPKKILSLYIHAFQSFLWNNAVELFIQDSPEYNPYTEMPIVGFASEDLDKYTQEGIKQVDISPRDFIINALPDLSSEGTFRDVWAKSHNLKVGKLEDDECYKGKKKLKIEFFLRKGSYATEFIRQNL